MIPRRANARVRGENTSVNQTDGVLSSELHEDAADGLVLREALHELGDVECAVVVLVALLEDLVHNMAQSAHLGIAEFHLAVNGDVVIALVLLQEENIQRVNDLLLGENTIAVGIVKAE